MKQRFPIFLVLIHITSFLSIAVSALSLTVGDKDSVCEATALIIQGTLDYYDGTKYGGTVGMFQNPYYWWEAGEAFGGLIANWHFCQNDTYEDLIYDALIAQRGSDNDYIPSNQSMTEGNDDQAFWGFAVMEATERNFTNPPDDEPGWLALSQAVYNTMWARWDADNCNGGLRWQIFTWNTGYDYKNTISNACLFLMAARLARYTQNDTYVDTATTVYNWLTNSTNFVVETDGAYSVYDGANIGSDSCGTISEKQWTYNFGVLLAGTAYLYNYTEDSYWSGETGKFYQGISNLFLNSSIIYERQCQESGTCNNDQKSFKSIFSRCLGATARLVPEYSDEIMTILEASATGAAKSCSGGDDRHTCGVNWAYGSWDSSWGLGEQISALEVIQNTLVMSSDAPYSNTSGGTSIGNVDAGIDARDTNNANEIKVSQKDKVSAAITTAIVLAILMALSVWMII